MMTKLYFKRFIYYIIYLLLAVGVPATLIIQTYGLFEQGYSEPGEFTKLRAIAMITLVVVLILGVNGLISWFKSLPDVSAIKTYPLVMIKPIIFATIYLLLLFSDKYIERIQFITFWSTISNGVAIMPAIAHRKAKNQIVILETQSGARR